MKKIHNKNKSKPKLVITSGYRWSYFQWFLLGFEMLQHENKIDIEYHLPLGSRLLMHTNSNFKAQVLNKFINHTESDSYLLKGYLLNKDGIKKYFCIDSADSPYLFDVASLKSNDVYFKMQCPKDITTSDYELTNEVHIPWTDHEHVDSSLKLTDRGERKKIPTLTPYLEKIKPLMIGPRKLADGCSYSALKKSYDNYTSDRRKIKQSKIMCYFGNAMGPGVEKNISKPDFDWEKDIMGYYQDEVSHPNEKRAKVAQYIAQLPGGDARIISEGKSDSNASKNQKLIIPLKDFCKHIAKFQYNMNVSGYRLSIPNRFIESFIVGTAIFTDQLNVKWYRPFDDEVRETVKMGYLPMNEVNWNKFKQDLYNLPSSNSNQVIKSFEEKWAPDVVAKYIIDTVTNS